MNLQEIRNIMAMKQNHQSNTDIFDATINQMDIVMCVPEDCDREELKNRILRLYDGDPNSPTIDEDIEAWAKKIPASDVEEILSYTDKDGIHRYLTLNLTLSPEVLSADEIISFKYSMLIALTGAACMDQLQGEFDKELQEAISEYDNEFKQILLEPLMNRRKILDHVIKNHEAMNVDPDELEKIIYIRKIMSDASKLNNESFQRFFNNRLTAARTHARMNDNELEKKALRHFAKFNPNTKLVISPTLWELETIIVQNILDGQSNHPFMEFSGMMRAMIVVFSAHRKDFDMVDYQFISQVISDLSLLLATTNGDKEVPIEMKEVFVEYIESFTVFFRRLTHNDLDLDFDLYLNRGDVVSEEEDMLRFSKLLENHEY